MCFGTMGSSMPGLDAWGSVRSITTVVLSAGVTDLTFLTSDPFFFLSASLLWMASIVHTTSSAVMGSPSDHLAFGSGGHVHFFASPETSQASAIPGATALSLAANCTRGSYW